MLVIKNINNNVCLCLDSRHREVVAFGKGIGFQKPPYEVPLAKIERTYYQVPNEQIEMLGRISGGVFDVSRKIVGLANERMGGQFLPNVIFTLADHIDYAIRRCSANISIRLPLFYEIRRNYPVEAKIGSEALEMIRQELHVSLPEEEASAIALHFINYKITQTPGAVREEMPDVTEDVVKIIEETFEGRIDRASFNYYRFVTHLHYLAVRVYDKAPISSENDELFEEIVLKYPKCVVCVQKISELFRQKLKESLTEEEQLYLILHINRLCTREDLLP